MQDYLLQFDADTDDELAGWEFRHRYSDCYGRMWIEYSNGLSKTLANEYIAECMSDDGYTITPEQVKQFCDKLGW